MNIHTTLFNLRHFLLNLTVFGFSPQDLLCLNFSEFGAMFMEDPFCIDQKSPILGPQAAYDPPGCIMRPGATLINYRFTVKMTQ